MKQDVRRFFLSFNLRAVIIILTVVVSFTFAVRVAAQEVDTSASDARIKAALAKVKSSNATDADKRALAEAYLERANIYYNAGVPQLYKLALGDLRRALRYDPNNTEAREKAEMLISIYKSMGRPIPPNGSDPNDDGIDPKESMNKDSKSGSGVGVGTGVGVGSGIGAARRVRFTNNHTTRTLSGTLSGETPAKYLFAAQKGQKLSVRVVSTEKNVSVKIYNARTKALLKDANGVRDWTSNALESDDYLIEIASTQRNASYTVEVKISGGESVETRSY